MERAESKPLARERPSLPNRDRVLLALEAEARGFKSPLAFKRWCRRHKVTITRDEKMLWIRPDDVDAALRALASLTPPANTDAAAAVESFLRRSR